MFDFSFENIRVVINVYERLHHSSLAQASCLMFIHVNLRYVGLSVLV